MAHSISLVPRIAGHSNRAGGAPRAADGTLLPTYGPGSSQTGHAQCSCGEISPPLPSGRERKLWHIQHREELAGVPWR
jgi:hypothetical protein